MLSCQKRHDEQLKDLLRAKKNLPRTPFLLNKRTIPKKKIVRRENKLKNDSNLKMESDCQSEEKQINNEQNGDFSNENVLDENTEDFSDSDSVKLDPESLRDCDTSQVDPANTSEETEEFDKRFRCPLCAEVLGRYTALVDHLFNHAGAAQSCLKCKKTFNNAISFKFHEHKYCQPSQNDSSEQNNEANQNIADVIRDILICPYCGNRFSKVFNLRRHLWRTCNVSTTNSSVNPDDLLPCPSCEKSFASEKELNSHKEVHARLHCSKCDATFTTKKLMKIHLRTVQHKEKPKYECEHCKEGFLNRASYRTHLKDKKHLAVSSSASAVWCHWCRQGFWDVYTYRRHCTRSSHLAALNVMDREDKPFTCEVCGTSFKCKDGLQTHMKRLHAEVILSCDLCAYTTRIRSNMTRHKSFKHKKETKNFACDECPVLFTSSYALKNHKVAKHTLERNFVCDVCMKAFKTNSHMKRHKLLHSSVKSNACPHCPMLFHRANNLRRHVKSKHEEPTIIMPKVPLQVPASSGMEDQKLFDPSKYVEPLPLPSLSDLNNQVYSLTANHEDILQYPAFFIVETELKQDGMM